MVLFQKFFRRFGLSIKMAPQPQESFQQSLVEIGSVFSEEKIFFSFIPYFFYFKLGGHLGWKSGSPDTILKGGHPRIIPQKFGCNWPSGF
jgi:hypothetical protein